MISPAIVAIYAAPMRQLIVAAAIKARQLYPTDADYQAYLERFRALQAAQTSRHRAQPQPQPAGRVAVAGSR